MRQNEIQCLISMGFTPASYYKRSVWVKVERVMEYLANKGMVNRVNGEVKYATIGNELPTSSQVESWAKAYMESPLSYHLEGMKKLSKELGLPLNSIKLLQEYTNTKIA